MPFEFELELSPSRRVTLTTFCSSGDLDMSRTEDGIFVTGQYWGCLDIVHDFSAQPTPIHEMSFSGTRVSSSSSLSPLSSRTSSQLIHEASKPIAVVKCTVQINSPTETFFDLAVTCSPMWKLTGSWPPLEDIAGSEQQGKAKWFVKAKPNGALEHLKSGAVVNELYYEAT